MFLLYFAENKISFKLLKNLTNPKLVCIECFVLKVVIFLFF